MTYKLGSSLVGTFIIGYYIVLLCSMWTLRHVCSTYVCPCDSKVQCTCYYNYVFTGCVSGLYIELQIRTYMLYNVHSRQVSLLLIHIEHKERYKISKLFAVWSVVSIYDIPYYVGYCQMGYGVFNSRVQNQLNLLKIDKYQFMVSEILFYLE